MNKHRQIMIESNEFSSSSYNHTFLWETVFVVNEEGINHVVVVSYHEIFSKLSTQRKNANSLPNILPKV